VLRIGVISDTHGLLRAEALEALRGSDHIVHGGDIGKPEILRTLSGIAPVTAVRGNNDKDDWAEALPEAMQLQFEDVRLYLIHDLKELDIAPETAGISVVISGHSHKPVIQQREGVTYLNPGSAGPRRFRLPIAVAALEIEGAAFSSRILHLDQE